MTNYKFAKSEKISGPAEAVLLLSAEGELFIPFDPANTDYQAFLKYQAEGGKVYGADESSPSAPETLT